MRRLPQLDKEDTIEEDESSLSIDSWSHQRTRRHSEPPPGISHDRRRSATTSSSRTRHPPPAPPPTAIIPETSLPTASSDDSQVDLDFFPKRGRSQSLPHISTQVPPNATGAGAASSARRPLYPAHLPVPDAMQRVQQHQLFMGVLEVDWQDSSDAYVICENLHHAVGDSSRDTTSKIYIYGSRNRNRALHGDFVAVELVDVETMMAEKAAKKQARRRSSAMLSTSLHSIPEHSTVQPSRQNPTYCGRVVSILERPKRMLFSGTLSLDRPSSQPSPLSSDAMAFTENNNANHHRKKTPTPKIIWFVPADKRLPLVAVPVKHAPQGFIKHHDEFKYRIFIGSIQRWPVTSLHPFGTVEREIGWMGELDVHSKALLADHHLKDIDFTPALLRSASNAASLSPEEHKRLDLQALPVFTLSDAPFPDHGFSIKRLENGTFEVGIHAADVASIIRPNSLMSREARERGVAVSLVERRIPMVPNAFADENATFLPGKTRMALSVLCRLTKSGVLLNTWIGETWVTIADPSSDEVQDNKEMLYNICKVLQTRRIRQDKAVHLSLTTLNVPMFEMDPSSGYPCHITRPHHREEEGIEKELMILSGQQVAQKILSQFPEDSFLCRQTGSLKSDPHQRDLLLDFLDLGRDASYIQTVETAEQLADENQRYAALYLLQFSPEQYVCSGSVDIARYRHEAYAVPVYTVFAEPLQKYACLIVQNQLHAVLRGDAESKSAATERGAIEKAARHCSSREIALHNATRASRSLFTSAYVYRECLNNRPVVVPAVVIGLAPNTLTVYLPDFDLEKEVHMHSHQHHGLLQSTYHSSDHTVELLWEYDAPLGQVGAGDDEEKANSSVSLPVAANASTPSLPVGKKCGDLNRWAEGISSDNEDHDPLVVTLEDEEHGVRQTSTVTVDFMTVLQVHVASDMKVVRPTLDIGLVNPLAP
ncbi:hypothetical protein BX666DRAFT_1941195 [Dichotomocladium elegans]|nr:hypothetical protein BX666DRAFT_1941195 [Dichotomocladium elegans]